MPLGNDVTAVSNNSDISSDEEREREREVFPPESDDDLTPIIYNLTPEEIQSGAENLEISISCTDRENERSANTTQAAT